MSLFGQASGSSMFGQQNQQSQNTNPFGSAQQSQQKPNLFGSLNTNPTTSQPQQGGGLFGSAQPAPAGGGLFGSSTQQSQGGGGLFGSSSQPAQTGGLFGNSNQASNAGNVLGGSQAKQGGGLFGSSQTQQQGGGGLFGSSQPTQGGGLFGSTQPQQQQQQSNLFGSAQPQQQASSSLFGNLGSSIIQQPQQQQQSQQQGSLLGQSQGSSRAMYLGDAQPRQKSVMDQIELAYTKWNPYSSNTPFRTYLYNAVPAESVPFYGPSAIDDEAEWEEALAKRPIPGSIPVLARGFEEIGKRMQQQLGSLTVLRGRLYEINNGLNTLLQKHDLSISIRAAECRRKHQRLAKQCLNLAAKTQILRNRGFAMDSAEEALRLKLLSLEKGVLDPALNGRSEEIWARMVTIRERSHQLQRDLDRTGKLAIENGGIGMDEEVMMRAKKILEDYGSQLLHLSKELKQIGKDWSDWESSKPK